MSKLFHCPNCHLRNLDVKALKVHQLKVCQGEVEEVIVSLRAQHDSHPNYEYGCMIANRLEAQGKEIEALKQHIENLENGNIERVSR